MLKIKSTLVAFSSLSIYRSILNDEVINELYEMINCIHYNSADTINIINRYNEFYHKLIKKGKGCSLKEYIALKVILNENPYSNMVQIKDSKEIEPHIINAVKEDLKSLNYISSLTSEDIKESIHVTNYETMIIKDKIDNLPQFESTDKIYNREYKDIIKILINSSDWASNIDKLKEFYKLNGCGIWGKYKGFIWEGEKLEGVVSLDPIRLSDMIGYDTERQKVIDNTLAFLSGYPANNILLYGSRGTGKSSTVKAILNEYHDKGLRVVEISKKHLETFPKVIRQLKNYPQKFILFIDDLAFDDGDSGYTSLKAVLEGGLETRPENIIIYATSNRKHLIKEKFSDRAGLRSEDPNDEVRSIDTMEEKLSLSDRFGMTVTFTSPDQNQYLEIVYGLIEQRGLVLDKEKVRKKALQWEMWYNAKSPRTATQFVDWLESNADDYKLDN